MVTCTGEMHFREQRAYHGAMLHRHGFEVGAGHARDNACRLAVQFAEKVMIRVGDRPRTRNPLARQMRHQVEVNRQFVRLELLEQREYVAAMRSSDVIIGVFDAGHNTLKLGERADRIVFKPRR